MFSKAQVVQSVQFSKSMALQAPVCTSQTFSGFSPSQGILYSAFINGSKCSVTGKQASWVKGYV